MGWLKLLVRKADAFNKLDPDERWWFCQALFWLPFVKINLKTKGFKATQKTLARLSPQKGAVTPSQWQLQGEKICRSVELAVRQSPIRSNCLQKSLVLWFLLRCQDIDSELRIGVQRNQGEFQAHAWIERGGIVLNDSPTVRQQYAVFKHPIEVKL